MDDNESGPERVEVLRLAAFTLDGAGGNPAGVVLNAGRLDDEAMQAIAAEVGYPETAFLTPGAEPRSFRVRYFSPAAEIPFCGHATVASAVALAQRQGEGVFRFHTPVGEVVIEATGTPEGIAATFISVEPEVRPLPATVAGDLLGLLGLRPSDLDASLPLREAFAGNWHPVVAVADRAVFDGFDFDPPAVRELMDRQGWQGTVTVIHRVSPERIEARNLFPLDNLSEDPATGSAAAALGGYLRALGQAPARFEIRQGHHVQMPSRLVVDVPETGGIRVTGTVRQLSSHPQVEGLRQVLDAFNRHDLDAIMAHFADDCVFESPRGSEVWGTRFVGKDEVRRGLAARFEGIPDVRYDEDDHFACGNRGVSEWTLRGTTVEGERIDVRGCDLWTFDSDGRIQRKDSFWKLRQS